MKVARLHGAGDVRLHDESKPVPAAGEALLQVRAIGLCGSDLHWLAEGGIGDAQLAHPLVLGHEFAATTDTGERVAVDPAISCAKCEMCQTGNPNLCAQVVLAGHGAQDGALREFLTWPTQCLHHLPDSLSDSDGAMLEPLGVALHAVDLGHIRAGMTVGVYGCGPIGLLILQLARRAGATSIIATEKLPHRLDVAKALGAQHAIPSQAKEEIQEIRSATGGRGVDVAFEVAGDQEAVDVAFASTMPGGTVVLVGIPANDQTSFQASVARRKGLTIKMVRRMKHTYPRAIALVESGLIDVRSLVTHHFPLSKVVEAFDVARRREGLKVIVEPAQEGS
jgi:L-iditol 2-dehydrogenase